METVNDRNQAAADDGVLGAMNFDERANEMVKRRTEESPEVLRESSASINGDGNFSAQIESMAAKIPAATFFSLAVGSVGISLLLRAFGRKNDSQFIGQWVPTILTLGLYNKFAKLERSESKKAPRIQRDSADGRA